MAKKKRVAKRKGVAKGKAVTKKKRVAKRKPAATRKPVARKKPTGQRPAAKRLASKPKAAAGRPLVAGGSVRDGVVTLLARQLRVSRTEADGKAIRALVAACGPDTQSLVASAINHDFSGLTRQFHQSDVSCDDTADTLAEEITNRMS